MSCGLFLLSEVYVKPCTEWQVLFEMMTPSRGTWKGDGGRILEADDWQAGDGKLTHIQRWVLLDPKSTANCFPTTSTVTVCEHLQTHGFKLA